MGWMSELDDHQLLAEFTQAASEPAFATLVERYVNLVYSTAFRRTSNAHHAEEITQAVFIILARKAKTLSPRVVLSGWLYQTARLTAANFTKSETRRHHREQEAYMQSTVDESGNAAWREMAPLLEEAMGRLGQTDRNAILLRFFENKNSAEIGEALRMNEEAARRRVNRALEKLRRFLFKRGVTSGVSAMSEALSLHSVQVAPVGLAKMTSAIALAKGAAAGGSTLALVKGALKIMAWTKAKTVAITSGVVLLAAFGTISMANHFRHAPPAHVGQWKLPTGNVTPMIAYGYSRYAVVLASDGSLWSWGEEYLGWPVLGLSDTNITKTVSVRRIGNENDWKSVAVGDSQCLAIKSDGTLWGWGGNYSYQVGDGTDITRRTPVPSIPGNDWMQAACGGPSSFGLKNDGTLWAWGNNWAGQLGTGNTNSSTKAVQVGSSTHWVKVWTGGIQTVGLQSDGSLWFWGSLTGDSQDMHKFSVPTRVSPDTNWVDVCFGYFTVFAIKSDGTLWSWGLEANFYTGATERNFDLKPMQVGNDHDWQSCSSAPGCLYMLLRKKDASLWSLDASEHRTVKPDTEYKPIVARKVNWNKGIAAYAAGGDNIGIILTPDGELWTWGQVLGEHEWKDSWGPNHERLDPKYRNIEKPWQLAIAGSEN